MDRLDEHLRKIQKGNQDSSAWLAHSRRDRW